MDSSEQVEKVSAALVLAVGEMQNATFDARNPHFGSRYTSLPALLDLVRPILAKHGLAAVQLATSAEGGRVGVETILLHASGQYLSSVIAVTPQKQDPQGAGSAITYCRRYALAAALGIGSEEDDDGNEASKPARQAKPAAAKPAAKALQTGTGLDDAWPPVWLAKPLGFGKWKEKTWEEMAAGGLDSGRAEYLRWLLKEESTTAAQKDNHDRARLVLAYIERDIPVGDDAPPVSAEDF